MFTNHAGGYNTASLCGSLGVAAYCFGSVLETKVAKKKIAELFNWYKSFPFPEYQPEFKGQLVTTVADSYLCEDSVGTYMKAAKVDYKDKKRKARCAGTSADVVKKMITMLNDHFKK